MALNVIFASGFDYLDTSGIPLDWNTTGTDTDIDTTPGVARTGLGALRINSSAFGPTKVFTLQTKLLMMTAFNPNSLLPVGTKANCMILLDTTTNNQQVRVCYEPDGSVSVYNGNDPFPTLLAQSAAGVLDTSGYNYIACQTTIHLTLGTVRVWVNGVLVIDITGVKTRVTGSANGAQTWQLMAIGGSTATWHDDCCLCSWDTDADVTGTFVNGNGLFTAPVIYAFVPESDVSTGFMPSVGVDNFACVDDIPQQTVTYVSSNVVGAVDQYIHDFSAGENVPPIPAGFDVLACGHSLLAQLDAPGVHTLASNANGSVGADQPLTTSLKYVTTWRTPGPVASLAQLAATPFGPDLVS